MKLYQLTCAVVLTINLIPVLAQSPSAVTPAASKVTPEPDANYFEFETLQTADPIEVPATIFQGMTCLPTTDPTGSCTLGGWPVYAVNVSNVAQVQLAINFARNTGIRLVVKNTGHNFSGKSGGGGSLSIWTHNLKDMKFIPEYSADGSDWTGPAVKAGSGVQAFELYEFCDKNGAAVGITGGYIQGRGHSPLSSIYGMGADHVLEMEVVLPNGRFVTASETKNPDLFWALRGGGGSTYGVVTSMTLKAHPDMEVTSIGFTFSSGGNVTKEAFWKGIRYYFDYFIPFTDAGVYGYFFVMPSGEEFIFMMQPFFAPQMSLADTEAIKAPWLTQLADLGISIQPETAHYDTFHSAWSASFDLEVVEKLHNADGSRLFPRKNWEDEALLNATFDA
ncbi:hypothetical protein FQN52_006032 [Onygenales sp. PD_12]|nr:hypothetical protein FQN52_006032 [Onygenales sp. PD_12]